MCRRPAARSEDFAHVHPTNKAEKRKGFKAVASPVRSWGSSKRPLLRERRRTRSACRQLDHKRDGGEKAGATKFRHA